MTPAEERLIQAWKDYVKENDIKIVTKSFYAHLQQDLDLLKSRDLKYSSLFLTFMVKDFNKASDLCWLFKKMNDSIEELTVHIE